MYETLTINRQWDAEHRDKSGLPTAPVAFRNSTHPKLYARWVNDFSPLQPNRHMQNVTLTAEEFNTLIAQRETAVTEREALRGELKVVKIERDLLQEKLNAFLRKLFAAKSEASSNGQSELFNEAESGRAAQSKSYLWAQMNGSEPLVRLFGYAPGRGGTHGEQLYAASAKVRC
jgi:hypothetical protein